MDPPFRNARSIIDEVLAAPINKISLMHHTKLDFDPALRLSNEYAKSYARRNDKHEHCNTKCPNYSLSPFRCHIVFDALYVANLRAFLNVLEKHFLFARENRPKLIYQDFFVDFF